MTTSTAMTSAMVRATQREQVFGVVNATVFARSNVMHVDERRVSATRHLATALVPPQHGSPHRRRHRLGRLAGRLGSTRVGAGRLTHVDARQDLCIAARHRRHVGRNFDSFAASRLRGALARFAHRDGNRRRCRRPGSARPSGTPAPPWECGARCRVGRASSPSRHGRRRRRDRRSKKSKKDQQM